MIFRPSDQHRSRVWGAPSCSRWVPDCFFWSMVAPAAHGGSSSPASSSRFSSAVKGTDFKHGNVGSSPTKGTSFSQSSKNNQNLNSNNELKLKNKQKTTNNKNLRGSSGSFVAVVEFEFELTSEERPWTGEQTPGKCLPYFYFGNTAPWWRRGVTATVERKIFVLLLLCVWAQR